MWLFLLAGGDGLALLLGPEGEFVREIILEELAKGIDAAWRLSTDSAIETTRDTLVAVLGVMLPSRMFYIAGDRLGFVLLLSSGSFGEG